MRFKEDAKHNVVIDVHGHYGAYCREGEGSVFDRCLSGDAATVEQRAMRAGIRYTVVSPLLGLLPRGKADAVAGNNEAADVVHRHDSLLQWVIINPLQPETFAQASTMLAGPKCVGIKIHPEEHRYPIVEHGEEIFAFAAEHHAVILAHSGDVNSEPDDFVPFANAHPEVRLILAHVGNGGAASGRIDKQVKAIQSSKCGNIYTDTSSIRSAMSGLIEWAVAEVGADRLLFGTDTPLYSVAAQRARIEYAEITEGQREMIYFRNATRLLTLPELTPQ